MKDFYGLIVVLNFTLLLYKYEGRGVKICCSIGGNLLLIKVYIELPNKNMGK